jgi:hypothetical protein
MSFDAEWKDILENLGGESEIRQMAREQGFLGWKQGVIQPIMGFDERWMRKAEIVGLGIIVPSAILCMSRDLEDFDEAELVPEDYLDDYESLSERLLEEGKALLALDVDILEAERIGWIELISQVNVNQRANNIEGFQIRGVPETQNEVFGDFINKIHEMLQELEITTNLNTDDTELGFSDDFQNEWA